MNLSAIRGGLPHQSADWFAMTVGGKAVYLPIGNDMSVRTSSVVGIFDLDNTTTSPRTRLFLEKAQKEGMVVPCDDLPKSFIVTVEYGMTKVYESTLSSYTLEKRMK